MKSLEIPEIKELILRAVNDPERGMGSYGAVIEEDALEFLADMAGGDARSALNAIELGILTTPRDTDGKNDGSVLHKGKKIILLSLVEAVDLINE